MKYILTLLLCITLPVIAVADRQKVKKAHRDTEAWLYEIEPVTVGVQGTVVVKISSNSKQPHVAANQAKKNAVHAVIFKGIPSKTHIPGRRPLVPTLAAQEEFADFFDGFFAEGGEYSRFVALTNDGAMAGGDVVRLSRKNYKVSVNVTVNYDELRKYLEDNGVVKKLGAGF